MTNDFIAISDLLTMIWRTLRVIAVALLIGFWLTTSHGWLALIWMGGITMISYVAAVYLFKRKANL